MKCSIKYMCRLLETIRIDNGSPSNLSWHTQRINRSLMWIYRKKPSFNIDELIKVPKKFGTGKVKLRLLYDDTYYKLEYSNYIYKPINTLKLVKSNDISYALKYADRSALNELLSLRNGCDDILIVKNGLITDTSYCNIIFYDGLDWITPSKPLLPGTCRQRLLNARKIKKMDIKPENIGSFKYYRLINSMLEFDEQDPINISSIIF